MYASDFTVCIKNIAERDFLGSLAVSSYLFKNKIKARQAYEKKYN